MSWRHSRSSQEDREEAEESQDTGVDDSYIDADLEVQIERELAQNWQYLREYQESYDTDHVTVFNYPVSSPDEIPALVRRVMNEQDSAFMIQITTGAVLRDRETEEIRIFWASSNTSLFDSPQLIDKSVKKEKILDKLHENIIDENWMYRPNSRWIFLRLAYIRIYVYHYDRPMKACDCLLLPNELIKNRYLYTQYQKGGNCDNLCFFYAVAKFLKFFKKTGVVQLGEKLLQQYKAFMKVEKFSGLRLSEVPLIEKLFRIRINIYFAEKIKQGKFFPKPLLLSNISCSDSDFERKTVMILFYKDHAILIKDINRAFKVILCPLCNRSFKRKEYLKQHRKKCKKVREGAPVTKIQYMSGLWEAKKTIFEEIEEQFVLSLSDGMKKIKYHAVYDSEAFWERFTPSKKFGKSSDIIGTLSPFLIAVASNIPNFEKAKLFWIDESSNFVEDFIQHLINISKAQTRILLAELRPLVCFLKEKASFLKSYKVKRIYSNFLAYISRLPVITYNGAGFDSKILREHVIPALIKIEGKIEFCTVRQGRYLLLQTKRLRFVDTLSYLGQGNFISYEKFLKSLDIPEAKLKMPYEFMRSPEDLKYPGLPDLKYWCSTLRHGDNVLGVDYRLFEKRRKDLNLTESEALKKFNLVEVPPSEEKELEYYRKLFYDYGCKTLRDWVGIYTSFDVEPLVTACEKFADIFWTFAKCSIFRDYISLPGVSERIAFRKLQADTKIFLPSPCVYDLIRKHILGGLSTIYVREAIKGVTKINEHVYGDSAEVVGGITSFDMTNLYGFAQNPVPSGPELHRYKSKNYVPEFGCEKQKKNKMTELILSFLSWHLKKKIQTQWNSGEFNPILSNTRYRVDGYIPGLKLGVEIFGHGGHPCIYPSCKKFFDPDEIHPILKMKNDEVRKRDTRRINYLSQFFPGKIFIIYICQFEKEFQSPSGQFFFLYQKFLQDHPEWNILYKKRTESEILREIFEGKIFGFVLADFECCASLKKMTDMWPLFPKKVEIGREDTGEIMQKYLEASNLYSKKRLQLVQSHFARQAFYSTSLVQFYLEMGVKVSNVTLVIQYQPTADFWEFVMWGANLRLEASLSKNKDKEILGSCAKLAVNSFFGFTIKNPFHYRQVKFVNETELVSCMNEPRYFMHAERVHKDCFEVHMRKKIAHYRSPASIGLTILCNSKAHMLRAIYNVLCLINTSYWKIVLSDTDSLVIMHAQSTWSEFEQKCVPEQNRTLFKVMKEKYFLKEGSTEEAIKSRFIPGLLKKEFACDYVIGLSPKCYICAKFPPSLAVDLMVIKICAKGVQSLVAQKFTPDQYRRVLWLHRTQHVNVRGLKYSHGIMFAYNLYKKGLDFAYVKRKTMSNMDTCALDL